MSEWTKPDGTIDIDSFQTWKDMSEFLSDEAREWVWIDQNVTSPGAKSVVKHVNELIAKIQRNNRTHQTRNNLTAARQGLIDAFSARFSNKRPSALLKTDSFKDVEKFTSISSALVYEGMRLGVISFSDVRDREDIIGALWDIAPNLHNTSELSQTLKLERDSTRRTLRDELQRLKDNDAARLKEWEEKLQASYTAYVGWARRRSARWGKLTRSWENRHIDAETRIKAVENTYKEQMGLAAPVEYWNTKATQHKNTEFWARLWVLIFFPTALIGMAIAFNNTAVSLINSAQAAQAPGAAPFPTAVFIVASAGLASCAGLVFWVGRLLTKLYLSQHHLRQDAEERATMTKTYLALIENNAASPDDRQVILNALFRNTPDGIVKEDGGLDPSIAAALGKFLAK